MIRYKKIIICILILFINPILIYSNKFCDRKLGYGPTSSLDTIVIDDFEKIYNWKRGKAGNVSFQLLPIPGKSGEGVRIQYDMPKDGNFIYLSKPVKLDLTKKFKLSVWVRAKGDPINLEIKIGDKNNKYFYKMFPKLKRSDQWQKLEYHIDELGYVADKHTIKLEPPFRIELVILKNWWASESKKGRVDIDHLTVEGLNPHLQLSMNQIGFNQNGEKRCVVQLLNHNKKIKSKIKYKIINLNNNKTVFKGKISCFTKSFFKGQYWNISFDLFKVPGNYKLQAELKVGSKILKVVSYPFKIKKKLYIKELSQSQFSYIKSTRYPLKTKHEDPLPGGYFDTEYDLQKWMTTTPTWVWAMARWLELNPNYKSYKGFDPIDEIRYASKFCLNMINFKTGKVYRGVTIIPIKGAPLNPTPEKDEYDYIITKTAEDQVIVNAFYSVAMTEVSMSMEKIDPGLSKQTLNAAILSWRYLAGKKLVQSPDLGMFIWASMKLFQATGEGEYREIAKRMSKRLLGYQHLDYKKNRQKVFGRFFRTKEKRDFAHQHKFVHVIGIYLGLMELAETLKKKDPLRKKIMFHLKCFAYGYIKQTTDLNPYGLVAQALELNEKTKMLDLYYFSSPKSIWGTHGLNCDIMSMGLIALRYSRLTKDRTFADIAMDQLHWVLGQNPLGFCMVSGKGTTNPALQSTDLYKGPVFGGIPNGFASYHDGNTPRWLINWQSGEYWKPHNAMLLLLISELESSLLKNPFKHKTFKKRKTSFQSIYKKINSLSLDEYNKNSLMHNKNTWHMVRSSTSMQANKKITLGKSPKVKINYQGNKGDWADFDLGLKEVLIKKDSIKLKIKSSEDENAILEIKAVDHDGSTFMWRKRLSEISENGDKFNIKIKDMDYAWGGDKKMGDIRSLSLAISLLDNTSGYVVIDDIVVYNQ